jgi:hypothetical protein
LSPSALLSSEQLKEIVQDKRKTNPGASEVQKQADGKDILD